MRADQILGRTMKYGDELTLLEQGKTVEREQFFENSRNPLSTLTDLLVQRRFNQRNAIMRYQKRQDYAQQDHEDRTLRSAGMVHHGIECPCHGCEEGYKALMWDVLGLPRRGQR